MFKTIGLFLSVTAGLLVVYPNVVDTTTARTLSTRISINKTPAEFLVANKDSQVRIKATLVFDGDTATKAHVEYPGPKTCADALADKTYETAVPGASGDISCKQITDNQIELRILR